MDDVDYPIDARDAPRATRRDANATARSSLHADTAFGCFRFVSILSPFDSSIRRVLTNRIESIRVADATHVTRARASTAR